MAIAPSPTTGAGTAGRAQTWTGNDMDTYADDLAALVEALDLKDAIHVGHSTGGGEVARYIGRHGTKRVAKAVLVDAVTPVMVKTENPAACRSSVFDDMRAGVFADISQFWKDLSQPFFGANRPGAKVSQGILDRFWLMSMQCGLAAAYDCIKAFSETDFTEDLKKFDVPTLIIHGDDDQIVPIDVGGNQVGEDAKGRDVKVYKGAPHGLMIDAPGAIQCGSARVRQREGEERRTGAARLRRAGVAGGEREMTSHRRTR